jgi:hypothetical protein
LFALVPVRAAFVFNFAQTPSIGGRTLITGQGQRRVAMTDAQRYRMNAAECLSAAERCEPLYRGLTVAIAASWLSLARQQTAMDQLLAIWSEASADTAADESRWRFQYPGARTEPDKKPPAPSAAGRERVSVTAA